MCKVVKKAKHTFYFFKKTTQPPVFQRLIFDNLITHCQLLNGRYNKTYRFNY